MELGFDLRKVFLISLVTSLTIGSLIGIFIFLFGELGDIEVKILLTTVSVGGFSLAGLVSSVSYEKHLYKTFSLISIITAVSGFSVMILTIWEILSFGDVWKIALVLTIFSVALAHISISLFMKTDKPIVNAAATSTIVAISIVAGMLVYLVLSEVSGFGEFYFRLLGVFVILDVLGTIVTPILSKLNSGNEITPTKAS
jgi:hypothetical protein